jgi:hypothetical protein
MAWATLDVDAHLVESHKEGALYCYDGYKAFQPIIVTWAEGPYVPSKKNEKKDNQPYRYLAIRIRPRQKELFGDGSSVRYYAVVSNIWDMNGQELLEWQRGKAGTVEQIHDILKNELGAGVYPSARHGANAAWLRLQVITHNLIQLLKKGWPYLMTMPRPNPSASDSPSSPSLDRWSATPVRSYSALPTRRGIY